MDQRIVGFEPVVDNKTSILIVGSMPGRESIRRNEYYGHPRNRFWPMIETVLGIPSTLPYAERLQALNDSGVGLWDVLSSCERQGSSDAYIQVESEVYNEFASMLDARRRIRTICCNGMKAYGAFSRQILPTIDISIAERLDTIRLPSTSAANATYLYEDIVRLWAIALLDV